MKLLTSVIPRIFVVVFTLFVSPLLVAADNGSISIMRGFSSPLRLSEDASTIAIGDPNLIGVVTIKPNVLMINGQETGSTSLTVFGKSGTIYQYRIQISNDIAQLRSLIYSMEKKVTVEDVNGTIVLKGEVATPTALSRVLSVADRYMGGTEEPDFMVISDNGGVLAGNLDEKLLNNLGEKEAGQLDNLNLASQTLGSNGGGRRGGAGASRISGALNQRLMNTKGNLAQNISRASVVMAAKGKVMSLIKVRSQPKVEIQMRVVAVDRTKTDLLGIDWRLDGNKISVGSKLGGVVSTLPSPASIYNGVTGNTVDIGTSTLAGFFRFGDYYLSTFLKAVEEKGAATTLSEPLLTAVSGESASFLVGGSIPIPLQEISPGNATSNAIIATRIEFIEFGLRMTVRPTVLENGKISIILDQSISEPDYSNAIQVIGAAIPAFKQKTVSTVTESESGETWAVAGLLTEEDRKNLKAVPWISKVPVIGKFFENKDDSTSRNELMILVNARHITDANSTTTNFDGQGSLDPKKKKSNHNPEQLNEELSSDQNTVPKTTAPVNPPIIDKAPVNKTPVNSSNAKNKPIENTSAIKADSIKTVESTSQTVNRAIQKTNVNQRKTIKVEILRFMYGEEKNKFLDKAFVSGLANVPPKQDWAKWRVASGLTETDQKQITFLLPPEMSALQIGATTAIELTANDAI